MTMPRQPGHPSRAALEALLAGDPHAIAGDPHGAARPACDARLAVRREPQAPHPAAHPPTACAAAARDRLARAGADGPIPITRARSRRGAVLAGLGALAAAAVLLVVATRTPPPAPATDGAAIRLKGGLALTV